MKKKMGEDTFVAKGLVVLSTPRVILWIWIKVSRWIKIQMHSAVIMSFSDICFPQFFHSDNFWLFHTQRLQ